jgi:CTP-dependent riboflavin kinase
MTLEQIGQELGISRQRVYQILSRMELRKRLWRMVMLQGIRYGLNEQEIRALLKPRMRGSELLEAMEAMQKSKAAIAGRQSAGA